MFFKPIEGLDETDNRILEILSDNARAGYSDMGRQLGISRVAVKNRVESLEKRGFIGGYRTLINRTADPDSIRFFMDLEVEPARYEDVLERIAMFRSCRQIYSCTSANRIHVTGYAPDSKTLESFAEMLYSRLEGVTRIVFQVVTAVRKDSDGGIEYVRRDGNEHLEGSAGE